LAKFNDFTILISLKSI